MIANKWDKTTRLAGLRRFAVAITVLNILGHTVLGFEQSIAQPILALLTAYSMEILLELINAWSGRRKPLFADSLPKLIDFLLPAHVTALAVAMLLYANDRLWPIVFATATAIGSKAIFRAPIGKGTRHFYNPSNFGISITLLLFGWVGISPPYHFTENLDKYGDWLLPAIIVVTGSFLNARFTHRIHLILAWLGGFIAQAVTRSLLFDTPIAVALLPMTGLAFLLYTFYMVTDPATTPESWRGQIVFGLSVAIVYGLLLMLHVVFGLFFALTAICTLRGLGLYVKAWDSNRAPAKVISVQSPVVIKEA